MTSDRNLSKNARVLNVVIGFGFFAIGGIFIATFFIFFASNAAQFFYWPYDWPETSVPPVQAAFPYLVICIAILLAIVSYTAVGLLRQKRLRTSLKATSAIIAVLAIGGSAVLGYFASPNIPNWFYNSEPYLTWSNDQDPASSITVSWHSAWSTPSVIRYGTSPGSLAMTATSADFGQFHHVRITGLDSNTTYYYKVDDVTIPSKVKQFTTGPEGNASFSICIWSDTRGNNGWRPDLPELPYRMLELCQAQGIVPAFSICCGDIVGRGVELDAWRQHLQDITRDDFASNRSHVLAAGNHERHDDVPGRNLHSFYPYQNTTYSFDYGQLHVVVIDPWDTSDPWWGDQLRPELVSWIDADLKAHANSTFKIMAMHPTPVESDGSLADDPDGHNGAIGQAVVDLATQNGVDVLFAGHWHGYWRYTINGTVFVTMGIGGNYNNNFDGDAGYCRVDVNTTTMDLHFIRADDNYQFDSLTIMA